MKSIVILFSFFLAFAGCEAQTAGVQNLTPQDLQMKLQEKNVVLIDVRTAGEVASGYIPEATHFIDINSSSFDQQVAALDTSKTYIMYCRSGGRSARAADIMVSKGFKNVFNLQGGISSYTGNLKK